jgi:ketosteroid isomerase-like protein
MNIEWARRRAGGAAVVLGMVAVGIVGAVIGGGFRQAKGADSAHARLQKVEDRQAIEQLLMGDYPRALDAFDWKAYSELFAKDGTLIMNGGKTKRTGPAAIEDFFNKMKLPTPPESKACPAVPGVHRFMHVVSNLSLHIDGDTATDQAYWETIGTTDCKSVVEGAGHYEDVLKREDGRWKFSQREIFDDLPPRTVAAAAASTPKP